MFELALHQFLEFLLFLTLTVLANEIDSDCQENAQEKKSLHEKLSSNNVWFKDLFNPEFDLPAQHRTLNVRIRTHRLPIASTGYPYLFSVRENQRTYLSVSNP